MTEPPFALDDSDRRTQDSDRRTQSSDKRSQDSVKRTWDLVGRTQDGSWKSLDSVNGTRDEVDRCIAWENTQSRVQNGVFTTFLSTNTDHVFMKTGQFLKAGQFLWVADLEN